MRKYTICLLLIALLSFTVIAQNSPSQESLGDSYFPELGNAGIDVQHYHLDIIPDFESETLTASVVLLIEATQELDEFNLDFWGFDISDLTINRIPVDFRRDEIELTVIPPETIAEGELFSLAISYSGTPREGLDTRYYFIGSAGWIFHENGSFVTSEPRGASLWYPANDHPQDKATYSFDITVPESYVVATSGQLIEVVENDGFLIYKSEAIDPTASYLTTVHIGDFVLEESSTLSGIPIRNYFPRAYQDVASFIFSETAAMLTFYEGIIGDYPFEVYGSVVSDYELPFALETQTLSTFGTDILDDTGRTHVTLAHELVHQWFGDSVSPARWQDIWLNEGFASYLSLLWANEKYGSGVMEQILDDWYATVSDADFLSQSPNQIGNPTPNKMFHGAVYFKGALTLHALRLRMGDELFFSLIRNYYQTFQNGHATIEDFVLMASEFADEDLTEFFNAWLYEKSIPKLN